MSPDFRNLVLTVCKETHMKNLSQLNELVSILVDSLRNLDKREKLLKEFERKINKIWENDKNAFEDNVDEVLNDFVCDLAYYQPNPILRVGNKELVDNDKMEKEIKTVLEKLKRLSVEIPGIKPGTDKIPV